MGEDTKYCKKCNTFKFLNCFKKRKKTLDGFHPICVDCKKIERNDRLRKQRAGIAFIKEPIVFTEKICNKCKILKPIEKFPNCSKGTRFGNESAKCKSCILEEHRIRYQNYSEEIKIEKRKAWIRRNSLNPEKQIERKKRWKENNPDKIKDSYFKTRFGISLNDYNSKLLEQNHNCAICNKPESVINKSSGKIKLLAVDHDHITGQVRQLLCHKCNLALGLLNESEELLSNSINYLRKHKNDLKVA